MRLTIGVTSYSPALTREPAEAAQILERVASLIRGGKAGVFEIQDPDGHPLGFWEYDPG